MQMPKFDLFVCSNKLFNSALNMRVEEIMLKLYKRFQNRLHANGFANISFDVMRHMSDYELTRDDISALVINPVFLSEHYLTRHISMDLIRDTGNRFNMPWRTQPSMDAYAFVNRGKAPLFHAMFIGTPITGKTYLMNEFKLMLQEIDTGIEIIECDNGFTEADHWDITQDAAAYADYEDRIKLQHVCIGGGPRALHGVDDKLYHNTRI